MAKVIVVKYFWILMITENPSTPAKTVIPAARANPATIAMSRSMSLIRIKTVPVASVANETKTVSQPTKIR